MNDNSEHKRIVDALLHPEYEWRTLRGIVRQAELPPERAKALLADLIERGTVRKSFVPSPNGEDLYGLVIRVDADAKAA